MSFINPKSLGQSVTEEKEILRLSIVAGGHIIEVPLQELKKVKENFPDITVTLTDNRVKRIEGRNLSTPIYSKFLDTLKKHVEINNSRNKRLNQPHYA